MEINSAFEANSTATEYLAASPSELYSNFYDRAVRWEQELLSRLKQNFSIAKENIPGWETALLDAVDKNIQGYHVLTGANGKYIFTGNPPKWKELLIPDNESLWGLNRMDHWRKYILAFYLTDDKKYLLQLKSELMDWIRTCPPPDITDDDNFPNLCYAVVSPWRSLEVGIRMNRSWPDAIRILAAEKMLDENELCEVAFSVYQHGKVLRIAPPKIYVNAEHNHYLDEMLGLFVLCGLFPELTTAEEWQKFAHHEVTRCAHNQLYEEGAQIEGCPSYHIGCLHIFCEWIIAANEQKLEIPESAKNRILNGIDYIFLARRPSGGSIPWGDSDSLDSAGYSSLLAYKAFHDKKWFAQVGTMFTPAKLLSQGNLSSQISLIYSCDLSLLTQEIPKQITSPLYTFQKHANIAAFRSSWDSDALHVFWGCFKPVSPFGIKNTHAHIDFLSFVFTAYGRPLITDPGRYTYAEIPERKELKSPEMHSCLVLDHKPPIEYVSSWNYGPVLHDSCLTDLQTTENCTWSQGYHTFYFPAIHQRLIAMVDSQFLVVWDKISHLKGEHHIDLYFHLDSTEVHETADGSFCTAHDGEANLFICSLSGLKGDTLPGYVSDTYGSKRPSTRVRFTEDNVTGVHECVTLLIPFRDTTPVVTIVETYWQDGFSCQKVNVNGKEYIFKWNGEVFYSM